MLTKQEISILFINWKDLIITNTKLIKSLRIRRNTEQKQSTVGDILCENVGWLNLGQLQVNHPFFSSLPWLPTSDFAPLNFLLLPSCRSWWRWGLSLMACSGNASHIPKCRGCHSLSTSSSQSRGSQSTPCWLRRFWRTLLRNILILSASRKPWAGLKFYVTRYCIDQEGDMLIFVCQVNEGMRMKENSERLEWLQIHVDLHTEEKNLQEKKVKIC